MHDNLILATDSYKVSHYRQYPPGTEHVYSYFESRGGAFAELVPFGLQYFLLRYLSQRVTKEDVEEAATLYAAHFGDPTLFNREGWLHIVEKHGGKLPLEILAIPEGTVVEPLNVLFTVENTDPKVPWLTNWVETLLAQDWYPTTVATQSRAIRKLILGYLEATGDPAGIGFKLHDFGFRGVSSVESAGLGGCAHLVNFLGTDTVAALTFAQKWYGHSGAAGFSIPAAEHSTITSWGREHEVDAYRNMIQQFGKGSLYAVVSDSYDIYRACRELWGGTLLQEVLGAPGTLVVRPDSGVPYQVVPDVIATLIGAFGSTVNSKGYHVLNPKVRVIQGDGVDYQEINRILAAMQVVGQSADNIAFGMGGALLQKLNRDTCKFAFKCSSVTINGEMHDVWKDPVTDQSKASKRGRLRLIEKPEGGYRTVSNVDWDERENVLVPVFRNGEVLVRYTLDQIRERANSAATTLVE